MHAQNIRMLRLFLMWLAIAIAVLAVAWSGFVAYFAWALSSAGTPSKARCSTVMEFAGGSMPAQAAETTCMDDGGWQDRGYTVDFRMPREDVANRLTAAFPRVRLSQEDAAGLSFSNHQETNGTRPPGQAMFLDLSVTYDDDRTARVHLKAFNV